MALLPGLPREEDVRAALAADVGIELARARASASIRTAAKELVEAAKPGAKLPPGAFDKWLFTALLAERDAPSVHKSTKTARRRARGTGASAALVGREVGADPVVPRTVRPRTDGGALQQAVVALGIDERRAGAILLDICRAASRAADTVDKAVASGALITGPGAGAGGLRVEWEGATLPGEGRPQVLGMGPALCTDAAVAAAKALTSAAEAERAAAAAVRLARAPAAVAASAALPAVGAAASQAYEGFFSTDADAAAGRDASLPAGGARSLAQLPTPWLLDAADAAGATLPCAVVPGSAQSLSLCRGRTRLRLNPGHYVKLGRLYARGPGRLEPWRFHERLFLVLLRYHGTQGGGGFQAAAHAEVFGTLGAHLGADMEAFASPLNCRFAPFCTAFPDTDVWFGGAASFFDTDPAAAAEAAGGASFEANPPFVPAVLSRMQAHVEAALLATSAPLSFAVIIPQWEGEDGWRGLADSPMLRRRFTVAQREHGYLEGSQHWRRSSFRVSTCDTTVFVIQNDAGAERWPATDATEAAVRAAFVSKHETLRAKRERKAAAGRPGPRAAKRAHPGGDARSVRQKQA